MCVALLYLEKETFCLGEKEREREREEARCVVLRRETDFVPRQEVPPV